MGISVYAVAHSTIHLTAKVIKITEKNPQWKNVQINSSSSI